MMVVSWLWSRSLKSREAEVRVGLMDCWKLSCRCDEAIVRALEYYVSFGANLDKINEAY